MSAFIQGGPTPVVASSAEAAVAFKAAEHKEPAIKEIKSSARDAEVSRYTHRKAEGKNGGRGQNVDMEV
jgi:hypothetical protein